MKLLKKIKQFSGWTFCWNWTVCKGFNINLEGDISPFERGLACGVWLNERFLPGRKICVLVNVWSQTIMLELRFKMGVK